MTATVTLTDDALQVRLHGTSAEVALKGQIDVPLAAVRGARVEPVGQARSEQGVPEVWPIEGEWIPGVVRIGSFGKGDTKQFWYVHEHSGEVLVIDLDHEKFSRVVLEVDDAAGLARQIGAACSSTG
jgi:hypothetical protein